ncbi:MAG TPA: hypothetical protein VMS08_00920 [Candidatus Saccharimonadia bacterium]|nr:hypothetical protein [Candidatus Saccharimonadia bacterium]
MDTVTLREYVDMRFEASKEAISAALSAADRAVAKAEIAVEKRFDNTNEWRGTVESLQRDYPTRTETNQAFSTIDGKLEVQQKIIWIGLGIVLAGQFFLGIALAIVLFFLRK